MWLLPSRGRPESVKRFFYLWKVTGCSTPGILWVDGDDAHSYAGATNTLPENWRVVAGPRFDGLGALSNAFFSDFPNEPWYGLLADDIIPRSKAFDRVLLDALPGGGLCYPDDGRQHEKTATHPLMDGAMVRELGWVSLPGLKRIYIDNTLMEYARHKKALKYVPEAKLFHLHFSDGTAPMDSTYEKPGHEKDKEIYEAWLKQLSAA